MDLATLVANLTTSTADLTNAKRDLTDANGKVTSLEATITERDATIVELNTQLAAANAVDTAALTTERDAAVAALSEVAQGVLTKVGKLNVELPKTVVELTAVINEHSAALVIAPGGKAKDTPVDLKDEPVRQVSAFRSAR